MTRPYSQSRGAQIAAVVVSYAPGPASPSHHHAGSVFAFVLTGAMRSGELGDRPGAGLSGR